MNFDELEHEFYEDLDGAITGVARVGDDLHVAFECDHWRDNTTRVAVTVCCSGVVESTATPSSTGLLTRASDHPLLWQHTEPHADLYFSSAPSNEFELLGHLYAAHTRVFGDWRSPADYIHANADILRAGYGLLAHGPTRAIAAYRNAATPFLLCSVVSTYTPPAGRLLLLFDECFVICRHVSLLQSSGDA
jgi:hypothetical protein